MHYLGFDRGVRVIIPPGEDEIAGLEVFNLLETIGGENRGACREALQLRPVGNMSNRSSFSAFWLAIR